MEGVVERAIFSRDGTPLKVWHHAVPGAPLAIGIFHGVTGNGNRHIDQIKFYRDQGYSVFWSDFRGHGKSRIQQNETPHIEAFSEYVEDADAIITYAKTQLKEPMVVSGHSLGGIVLTHWLGQPELTENQNSIKGFIADTPTYGPSPTVKPWVVPFYTLGGEIANALGYGKTQVVPFAASDLGRSPWIGQSHLDDPQCSRTVSLEVGRLILSAMRKCTEFAKNIWVPTLMMAGTGDRIASHSHTESNFARLIPNPLTELKIFQDAGHELFFDVGYPSNEGYQKDRPMNEYYTTLRGWLARLSASLLLAACLFIGGWSPKTCMAGPILGEFKLADLKEKEASGTANDHEVTVLRRFREIFSRVHEGKLTPSELADLRIEGQEGHLDYQSIVEMQKYGRTNAADDQGELLRIWKEIEQGAALGQIRPTSEFQTTYDRALKAPPRVSDVPKSPVRTPKTKRRSEPKIRSIEEEEAQLVDSEAPPAKTEAPAAKAAALPVPAKAEQKAFRNRQTLFEVDIETGEVPGAMGAGQVHPICEPPRAVDLLPPSVRRILEDTAETGDD